MLQSQGGTPLLLTPPCNAKLSILPKPSKPLPKLPVLSHVMLELTSLSQPSTFLPSPLSLRLWQHLSLACILPGKL